MTASDLFVSLHFDFLVAAANDSDNVVKAREARQRAYARYKNETSVIFYT